jgi:glycyl-tRNA synthetase
VPFGIAQIGKAFRNEITARQFIFRTREFEQMEMQYFTHPDQEMVEYEKLRQLRWQYYLDLGIKEENLQWHKHENLVFYAKEAYDIEYRFPFGFKELEGVHARGNYDLTQHSKFSGHDLDYKDPITGEKYIPHIIESSVGVGRTMLAVLTDAYHEEEVEGETRLVMKFPKHLAPFKVAVLPLSKKDELSVPSRELAKKLRKTWMTDYDETQSIGKRYRRQDEIGTPFCVTVDFETLTDNAVTVRERDSMKQERVPIAELEAYLRKNLE